MNFDLIVLGIVDPGSDRVEEVVKMSTFSAAVQTLVFEFGKVLMLAFETLVIFRTPLKGNVRSFSFRILLAKMTPLSFSTKFPSIITFAL